MATFLDLTLLKGLSGVFTFLLVWIVAFGVLEMSSFMEGKKGLSALLAFFLAFLVFFTAPVRALLEYVVPWFAVIAVIMFFLMFVFMVLGMDVSTVTKDLGLKGWVMTILVIVVIFGVGAALNSGPGNDEVVSEDGELVDGESQKPERSAFAEKFIAIFTHPKFLGAAFLLLLGSFTIGNLSKF